MTLYSVNGRLLAQADAQENLLCCKITKNGEFLVTSSSEGTLTVRQLFTLQVVHKVCTNLKMFVVPVCVRDMCR